METLKGVISSLSKDGKRFKIGEQWYSCFALAMMNGAKIGDTVSFSYIVKESGGQMYNNVKGSVTVLSGGGGEAAIPAYSPSKPSFGGGESPERNMSIIRQNALTNAVNFYNARRTSAIGGLIKSSDDEVVEIVEIADLFVKFTSGEYERNKQAMEAVEMEAKADVLERASVASAFGIRGR